MSQWSGDASPRGSDVYDKGQKYITLQLSTPVMSSPSTYRKLKPRPAKARRVRTIPDGTPYLTEECPSRASPSRTRVLEADAPGRVPEEPEVSCQVAVDLILPTNVSQKTSPVDMDNRNNDGHYAIKDMLSVSSESDLNRKCQDRKCSMLEGTSETLEF